MTRIDSRPDHVADNPPDWVLYRAVVNGEDVSARCFLADDETGEVGLYLTDEAGHFYYDPLVGDAAHEITTGNSVVLIPPEP